MKETSNSWSELNDGKTPSNVFEAIVIRQAMFDDGMQAVRLEEPFENIRESEERRTVDAVVDSTQLGKELKSGERVELDGEIVDGVLVISAVAKEVSIDTELSEEEKEAFAEKQSNYF